MTVDEDQISSFNDSQKTVYLLDKRSNNKTTDDDKIPMVRLGEEDPDHIQARMLMFQKFWASKLQKIQAILTNKNTDLFQEIANYLMQPNQFNIFKTALLMMGTNLSNHALVVDNLVTFLTNLQVFKIVRLSSKDCTSIKSSLISLISQIIETADEDQDFLRYDFDFVVDQFQNKNQQVVVIFEDSELFEPIQLAKLVNIINSSPVSDNFKLIFGLSSSVALFEENLPSSVIDLIEGQIFNLDNSGELLNQITEKILFNLDIQEDEEDFLLLLGPALLNQLSKYEDNELLFIDALQYSYSMYFFNNPLSILNLVTFGEDNDFEIDDNLVELLRRTHSFKKKIEKLSMFNQNEEILDLFQNNAKMILDFKKNHRNLYKSGFKFYKLLDLFILLQKNFNNGIILKTKYQLYSSMIQQGTDFYESQFYQELLSLVSKNAVLDNFDKFLKEISHETFITQDQINEALGEKLIGDINLPTLKFICKKMSNIIDHQTRVFFQEFDDISYKEVFTIEVQSTPNENILSSGFNPFIRSRVESALNNPNSYLFKSMGNSPEDELAKLIEPTLCELFTLYRELSISINIHDFFIAFKESIQRRKLVAAMLQILESKRQDEDLQILYNELSSLQEIELSAIEEKKWEKITLSWFLQLMSDLEFIGFIKEAKKKSEAVEKLVWKGI